MKTPSQITFDTLMQNLARGVISSDFSYTPGFHIYGDLSLNLPLSAAEDDKNASRYLDILQDYASIVDVCAQNVGAHLLEVQGERIHILLPVENLSAEAFKKLFAFCISFTKTVYEKIKPKAGEHWGGFAMAADFGPSVLLHSDCGGGSIVSLGNAANRPAKRLGKTPAVKSGHCAIRREILEKHFAIAEKTEWVEVNVLQPGNFITSFADPALTEKMLSLAKGVLENRRAFGSILFANVSEFSDPAASTVKSPIRVRGVFMRADLDGFTKQVEAAFAKGPQAILELVARFRAIMNYPRQFVSSMKRPAVELPWAGDCAPLILMPKDGEKISGARKYLPATAATTWHEQESLEDLAKIQWVKNLGEARWSIGVACGDEQESDGVLLVANLETSGRKFRVVAGWGARQARDAQESDNVKAEDTVLPKSDHANLDLVYQKPFREHDSKFMISTYKSLKQSKDEDYNALGKILTVSVPGIKTSIPAAKPFSHGQW